MNAAIESFQNGSTFSNFTYTSEHTNLGHEEACATKDDEFELEEEWIPTFQALGYTCKKKK
jgi:hypothetical protein